MIQLNIQDDSQRPVGTVLVNEDEISVVRDYYWHSYRGPCGSSITMKNGEKLLVMESPEVVRRLIDNAPEAAAKHPTCKEFADGIGHDQAKVMGIPLGSDEPMSEWAARRKEHEQ